MVALRIERQFTTQQILELYVNRIYFGNGCYGVETASQAYFGRERLQAEPARGGAPGRIDPQPQSIFTDK